MIFYFTGSGNSLAAAKQIGSVLGERYEDISRYKDTQLCCSDPVIGIVSPTYMGDLPWFVKKILLGASFAKDSYIFLVMTSNGGNSGNAAHNADKALCTGGCALSASFDIALPGNFIVSSDDVNAKRLADVPAAVNSICSNVSEKHSNFVSDGEKAGKHFVEDSYFYGMHSIKHLSFVKNYDITKDCTGCGICVSVCPCDNISIKNGRAVHNDVCAACCACVHWCPENATLINMPTLKHRPQYKNPDVTLDEMKKR